MPLPLNPGEPCTQGEACSRTGPAVVVRLDKWLWAVRLYKSRSIATAACAAGKVRIQGQVMKPARSVRLGEVITAVTGDITRTVKVTGLLERRVGPKSVQDFIEDLTPAAEYLKPRERIFVQPGFRPKGAGRPTKRDRRALDRVLD